MLDFTGGKPRFYHGVWGELPHGVTIASTAASSNRVGRPALRSALFVWVSHFRHSEGILPRL